ncbi:MAG: prepilin-type N-terminal cleavage/methylation domain-containing protein [Candidatus Saccharibacteria bacterium]|nr:prepilin-type N-terminal cleavage/methylation domain-containing protein [Candidatus Saccharibacteria bacterium]
MKKFGFTLIELLVVITVIGILAAIITTNFVAGRDRAYDAKAKGDLQQLKNALHSYYVNNHKYPPNNSPVGYGFKGCGIGGINLCTTSFAADGIEYLSKLPSSYTYFSCSSGDDFRLKVTLKNKSDPDIVESKLNCPDTTCGGVTPATLNYAAVTKYEYILCGTQ